MSTIDPLLEHWRKVGSCWKGGLPVTPCIPTFPLCRVTASSTQLADLSHGQKATSSRRSQTAALRLPSEIASSALYSGQRVHEIPYGGATQLDHMGVDRFSGDVGMAQQLTNRADVLVRLNQVGCECASKHVRRRRFRNVGGYNCKPLAPR